MIKKLIFIALSGFITFTSVAQSTTITPGSTQMIRSTSGDPLTVGMMTGTDGYFHFKRGGSYSAGILNSPFPKQLRIGIATNLKGVELYQDIVIDSLTRYIGFGTNNPQANYHFYSPQGNGKLMLEAYSDYPFLQLKGEDNGNKGITWLKKDDSYLGLFYYNGETNKMYWGFGGLPKDITIDGTTGVVGIGTREPTDANLHVYGRRATTGVNLKIEEAADGIAGYPGLALVKDDFGATIYGRSIPAGGITVTKGLGGDVLAPVYASGFYTTSDINLKKEVINLENEDFEAYLNQIRNIQSATYRYQWEDAETRKNSHIGFIAQSLPQQLVAEIDAVPNGSSAEVRLGYNLSDMIGLNVIGIKAVDAKIQKLEEIIRLQEEQMELQQEQISLLMAKINK